MESKLSRGQSKHNRLEKSKARKEHRRPNLLMPNARLEGNIIKLGGAKGAEAEILETSQITTVSEAEHLLHELTRRVASRQITDFDELKGQLSRLGDLRRTTYEMGVAYSNLEKTWRQARKTIKV